MIRNVRIKRDLENWQVQLLAHNFKFFQKLNLPDFLFLEKNELLKNFGETLDSFH